MTIGTMATPNAHLGRNVKRLREILGIKHEALAIELGSDWNQKKISALETKEYIDADLLAQVANALKVPVDAIENFSEEAAVTVIANNFSSNDSSTLNAINPYCTFNPLDKLIEVVAENKVLYERLLQSEKEKTTLLEGLMKELKK